MLGDIFGCNESGGRGGVGGDAASSGQKPGILLNILQCSGQPS